MDDQNADSDQEQLFSTADLLARIHRSRAALEETLGLLSEEELIRPGRSGWSIKDHLAHLAVWELGIAELLRRRPRFAAMGVDQAVSQGKSEDEINELIYGYHAGLPLAEIWNIFHIAHQQLLQALEDLDDEDLRMPYASFSVEDSTARDPVVNWIIGNTYLHFDEHHGYIQALLQDIGE